MITEKSYEDGLKPAQTNPHKWINSVYTFRVKNEKGAYINLVVSDEKTSPQLFEEELKEITNRYGVDGKTYQSRGRANLKAAPYPKSIPGFAKKYTSTQKERRFLGASVTVEVAVFESDYPTYRKVTGQITSQTADNTKEWWAYFPELAEFMRVDVSSPKNYIDLIPFAYTVESV